MLSGGKLLDKQQTLATIQGMDLTHYPDLWQCVSEAAKKAVHPPNEWIPLMEQLCETKIDVEPYAQVNPERKWEIASALQKSIRRSDSKIACRLMQALWSVEPSYAIRRLATTVAEDIGPANVPLMGLVLALAPKLAKGNNLPVAIAIVKKLCESVKSRTYCSLSVIDSYADSSDGSLDTKSSLTERQKSWLLNLDEPVLSKQPFLKWIKSASGRAEGLPKYCAYEEIDLDLHKIQVDVPLHRTVYGLPSYAYDMHTQIGKATIATVAKRPGFKPLIETLGGDSKSLIGYALFYAEGAVLGPQVLVDQGRYR